MLDGWKTYIAALGLIGLGAYRISEGDIDGGLQAISQGLALFGLRRAVAVSDGTATVLAPKPPLLR